VFLLLGIIVNNTGEKVPALYVDDYKKYYLFKKEYNPLIQFNFGTGGIGKRYKLWFLPGQKAKMLKKIDADIRLELTNVVSENNDIIKNYEIIEDNKNNKYIYIYYYNQNAWSYEQTLELSNRFNGLVHEISTVTKKRIALHNVLVNGGDNVEPNNGGYTLDFIEIAGYATP